MAHAATLTWDTVTGDGSTITGGTGTWTDGLGNWNTGSGDTIWNSATPDSAIFGGTAGTVTLGGAVTVGNMVFNSGYILAGGGNTLTLSNSTITVSTSATISAAIGGSTGLSKDGTGTLLLAGTNTYTGTTTISAGILQTGPSGTLGTGDIVNNGTLVLGAFTGPNLSQTISGTGKINITAGTVTLSGTNTYTGVTTVAGGTNLLVSTIGDGGVASNLGAASNAASNIVLVSNSGLNYVGTGSVTNTDRLFSVGLTGGILASQGTGAINFTNTGSMGFNSFSGTRTLTLTGTNTGNNSLAAAIGDNGGATSLTKSGASKWILNGTNTYSGTTTISGGILQVGNGGTSGTLGTGGVTNNSSLVINRSDTVTLANAISGTGTFTQAGTGTTILTGANSYSGSTTISAGVLQIGNGGTTGSLGTNTVNDNANLSFNRSDAITVSNSINGSGGVSQIGTGTTTLSAVNSYFGVTTVSAGVLNVTTLAGGGTSSNIGASSNAATNLVLNGGTLKFSPGAGSAVNTDRLFSVGTSGGTIDASGGFNINFTNTGSMGFNGQSGARTLTLTGNNANDNTLAAVIGDNGGATSVTKAGNGIWVLSGANTYTGVTTVSGTGVLKVSSLADGGVASNIGASSNAASNLVLNGGTLQYNNATTTSTDRLFSVGSAGGTISLPVAGTLNFTNTGNLGFNGESGARTLTFAFSNSTFGGVISLASGIGDNGGATSVVKANSFGTLRLTSDNNTYTGTTTINGGAVAIGNLGGNTGSIGTGEIIINAGGTLVASRSGSVTLAQTISGAGGVTANGNTMLTLSGTNTYTGVTRIISNGGVVTVTDLGNGGVASSIGASSSASGNLSITNLGTLRYVGTGASTDRLFEVPTGTANPVATIESSGSGALVFTNTGAMGFGSSTGARTLVLGGTNTQNNTMNPSIGDNAGATALTKAGAGTWILAGANTYTGVTTISGGVLQIGNGGTSGTLGSGAVANSGTLVFNRSDVIAVTNSINGSGGINQAGSGTTILTSVNNYLGVTTVSGGILSISVLNGGGTSSNIGAASNAASNIVINGGTLLYTGGAITSDRLFSVGTDGGTVNSSGTGALNLSNTGSMGFNGQSGARTLTLTGSNSNANTLAAVIADSGGATAVTKASGGNWTLSGANSYTGVTTVSGGVLTVTTLANGGSNSNIGASSNAASNLVIDGGTFAYAGAAVSTDRLFSAGTSGATLTVLGSGGVTFTNTGSMGFNGQTGARTLTLANASAGISTLAAVIGDNGGATSVTKINAGTWALTGANTYTGTTTISGISIAVLSVTSLANGGVASNIGASSNAATNLVLNGGTLQYTGTGASTDRLFSLGTSGGALDASGTVADLKFTNTGSMGFNGQTGARTLTLTGTYLGFNTVAAVIGDNGGATSVTKTGTGKWVLTGNNTYSGTTTISGGVLQIGYLTASGTAGTGNIVNNGILVLYRTDAFTLSNVISGTGTVNQAQGVATLAGLNTYTGNTSVLAGTLIVDTLANGGSASNIGASTSAANNLQISGGTFKYVGAGVSTDRLFAIGVTATIDASGTGALNFTNTGLMGRTLTAARTLTLSGTNTGNNTLAAIISDNTGATSLVKSGTGTWVLSGLNTYAGVTTVSGGVLSISSLANGGSASGIGAASNAVTNLVLNGGTLQYTGAAVSTDRLFSVGTNGGTLDASGTGAVNFTNTGNMGFNSQTGTRTLTLKGGNTGNNTLAAIISDNTGATSLVKSGTGTWVLSGLNTYAGVTTVSGGVLSISSLANGGSASGIGAASNAVTNLVLNGGTLQYTGAAVSTDRLFSVGTNGGTLDASGTGAVNFTNTGNMGFNSQTGTRTLTLKGGNTGNNTLAAVIGDNSGNATSVAKSGNGTWLLTGTNTYTGATTITGGKLVVTSLANGGSASGIGASSNAAANLVLSSATLQYTGGAASTDRLFSIGTGSGTLDASGSGAINFTNTGSMGFNGQSGTRTLSLAGTNTGANTIAAVIGDNGGATTLLMIGSGKWVLTGANSYTGITSINFGVLSISTLADGGNASSIGASSSAAANLFLNGGGTLQYTGGGASTDRLFTVDASGGKLDASGTGAVNFTNTGSVGLSGVGARTFTLTGTNTGGNTLAAVIGDNGGATSLSKSGTGTWVITGTNTYTGSTNVNAGTLQVGNGGTSGKLGTGTVNLTSSLVINRSDAVTMGNTISGSGTFTQAGTGTTTFTGANIKTYAGATFINAGKLQAGAANAFSSGSAVTVADGAVLEVNGFANLIGTLAGSGTVQNGAVTSATLSVGGTTSTLFSGLIQDGGSGALTLNRAGTTGILTLTGTNTYTGGTVISGATLSISTLANGGTASNIGASTNAASNLIFDGGMLTYTGAAALTDRLFSVTANGGALDSSGTGELNFTNTGSMGFNSQTGARSFTLTGSNTGANTLAAVISDNGGATSLNKTDTGTWLLTGNNTYTGTTLINGGVLQIGSGGTAGTLGSGGVTNLGSLIFNRSDAVTFGSTLSGAGTFTQAGTGTTTFTGSKNYTGATFVNAGTLQAGGANTFSSASAVTVASGAVLELNGFNNSIGGLAGSGTVQNGAATSATLTILGSGTSTFSGLIQDGGSAFLSLIKGGTGGTLTLTGSNTYTGASVVTTGVLSAAILADGGTASSIGASSNIASNLILNGGTLSYTGAAVSTDRLFTVTTAGGTLDASGTGGVSFTNTGSMGFNSESGPRALTLTGTGGGAIAAIIGDNGGATSLTKTGAGQWTLSGASTYTGPTTITGGQLAVSSLTNGGSASSIGAATSVAANLVINGGVLQYTGAAASTDRLFSVGTSGGTLDASGAEALNFTNTGSMGFNGQSGTRTLSLNGSNTGNNTLAAIIGDSGGATSLIKLGSGSWVLTGANTYTGRTRVDQGVLIISSLANGGLASNIGASSSAATNLILGLSALKYTGAATSTNRLFSVGTSGGTLDASGTGAVNFTNTGSMGFNSEAGARVLSLQGSNTGNNTIAANIRDSGGATSIYKNGIGLWVLTGTNLYTGINMINGGTLSVAQLANGSSASNLGASTNAAANLVLNGGALKYTGAATSTDRLFSVGTSGGTLDASGTGAVNFTNTGSMGFNSQSGARTLTLTGTNAGNNTLAAAIGDNGGATSLVKSGTGSWVLTGMNTYTGTTTISDGVLRVGNGGTSGTLGSGAVTDNGILVINHSNAILFANSISGSGSLVQQGAGTTTLTGANSYSGSTTISAGVLSVASIANGGSSSNLGASTNAATNLVINGGTLKYTGAAASTDRLFSVGTSGGTLDASGTGALNFTNAGSMGFNSQSGTRTLTLTGTNTGDNTLAAVIGDNGGATSLVKSGTGTWVLTGTNTYTGTTTISGGVLQAGSGSTTGSLGSGAVINNGSLVSNRSNDLTLANAISGSGSFTQAGSGTTTLSGTNFYTGVTTISAGVLNVTFLDNGGSSSNIGAATSDAANLVINGGTLQYSGAADASTDRLFSVGIGSAVIDVTGSGALNFTNTGSMGFNGESGDRNLLLTGTNSGVNTIAMAIGDFGGATSVSIDGSATWLLTGANTYTGATTVSSGVLQIGGSNLDSAIILGSHATLELNGLNARIGSLAGSGTVQNNSTTAAALTTGGNNTSTTFSGVIQDGGAGALSIVKEGSGTFTLTGANSYTGTTTISAGVLQVGSGGTTGTLGSGAVINNASLIVNRSDALTIANAISGSGSLTQAGAGTTTLTGDNSYSGSTTINAGMLSVAVLANGGSNSHLGASTNEATNLVLNGGTLQYTGAEVSTDRLFSVGTNGGALDASGTGAVNFTNTGSMGFNSQSGIRTLTLTGTNTGDNTLAAVVGDNGGATALTKSGLGTWVLTGNNSNSGVTTINAGVLQIGAGGTTGSLGSGAVTDNGSLIINRSDDIIVDNAISGSGSLTQAGSGTTTLTGDNGYTGSTTINAGVLSVAVLADGGSNSNLGASTNEATNLLLNGGVLQYTGADVSTDRLFSVGTGGGTLDASGTGAVNFTHTGSMGFNGQSGSRTLTLTGTNTGSNTLAAMIGDNGGATALTKSGAGIWVLAGTNTYTGTTSISAGELQVGAGGTTGTLGIGAVINNASLTVNRSDALTIANDISGSGVFTQAGSGTTTLTGDNSYSGSTTINAGVLSVSVLADGGASSHVGAPTNAASNLVLNGGTLQYTGGATSTDRLFSVGSNGGTLDASGTGAVNFTNTGSMGFNSQSGFRTLILTGTNTGDNILAAVIGDNGDATTLTKSGGGTWVLTAANTYAGATTVSGGTLQIGDGGTNGSLATSSAINNNGTLAFKRTDAVTQGTDFASVISGSGGVTQAGSGTLKLNGDNTYTGTTNVRAGTLEVTRNNALGTGAAGTTVSSGATLMLNNVNYSTSEALALNGGGAGGGGALRNSGTSSYTGAITAETNASINVGGGILNLTGGLVKDGTVLTITGGGMVYVSGTGISGASASSDLVVDGTTLAVGADSDYNGPTTVQNGAALIANASVTTTRLDLSSDSLLAGTGAITTAVDQSIFINGTFSVGDPGVAATASTFALTTSGSGAVVMGADSVIRLDLFSGAGLGNNLSNAMAADSINLHGKLDATAGGTVVIGNPNGMTNFRGGDQWQLVHLNSGDANAGSFAASLALNDSSLHLASGFTSYLDPSDGVFSIIDTNGGLALAAVEVQALVSGGNTVTSDLNGHLFNLRSGGGEEGDDSGSITAALDDGVIVGEGDGDPKKASPIAKRVARSRQWEVFATVNYGNVKLNPIRTQSGVQIDSWASGVGAERHFSRGLTLGFAASFLQSNQGYTSNAGSLHLEGPALSAYVSYVRGGFWNSLLYSFGTYQMDSIRNTGVAFPTAFGTTRTYTHSVQYNTGWNMRFQNDTLVTGPFAGVDYLHGSVDAYNETGGGLAALHYSAQSYQSLVSRVGWSASKQIKAGFGTITPQVRLSYERQNIKNNNGTSVSLINVPFSSTGGQQAPGQDYLVAGLGVSLAFTDRFSLMLSYQGQFFRHDLQAHFGSIRFNYQF